MSRISPRHAWTAFGVVTFCGFALWLLPLAVLASVAGLGGTGLTARTVDGTAWNGRMLDASFKGARLGDLQVRVSPLDLLTGTARFRVSALSGEGMSGEGYAGLSGQGVAGTRRRAAGGSGNDDPDVAASAPAGGCPRRRPTRSSASSAATTPMFRSRTSKAAATMRCSARRSPTGGWRNAARRAGRWSSATWR